MCIEDKKKNKSEVIIKPFQSGLEFLFEKKSESCKYHSKRGLRGANGSQTCALNTFLYNQKDDNIFDNKAQSALA